MPRVVRLNSAGLEAVLSGSEVSRALETRARSAAAAVEADPHVASNAMPVEVWEYVAEGGRLRGKRTGWAITIRHPGALAVQARYGVLTRAISSVGLRAVRKGGS